MEAEFSVFVKQRFKARAADPELSNRVGLVVVGAGARPSTLKLQLLNETLLRRLSWIGLIRGRSPRVFGKSLARAAFGCCCGF
jgi:hypothetical protein